MLSSLLLAGIRKAFGFRSDGQPQLYYLSAEECGVETEDFSFYSGKNLLRGKKHFLRGFTPKAIVFFFHGLGAGYTAYTQEICAVVRQGYVVYAYDNTGSMTSEGETIGCMAQSLLDQKAFFEYFDSLDGSGLPRYAMGHSWGGFTALGALDPAYHVEKVISISGFLSLPQLLMDQEKRLAKMEWLLCRALRKGYGRYGDINMADLLAHTRARVLYIQGEEDVIVPKARNYDILERLFAQKENISLLLVPSAFHNPYWTLEAQKYMIEIFQAHHVVDKAFDNDFEIDYRRLNEDDPNVMERIFSFLAE